MAHEYKSPILTMGEGLTSFIREFERLSNVDGMEAIEDGILLLLATRAETLAELVREEYARRNPFDASDNARNLAQRNEGVE